MKLSILHEDSNGSAAIRFIGDALWVLIEVFTPDHVDEHGFPYSKEDISPEELERFTQDFMGGDKSDEEWRDFYGRFTDEVYNGPGLSINTAANVMVLVDGKWERGAVCSSSVYGGFFEVMVHLFTTNVDARHMLSKEYDIGQRIDVEKTNEFWDSHLDLTNKALNMSLNSGNPALRKLFELCLGKYPTPEITKAHDNLMMHQNAMTAMMDNLRPTDSTEPESSESWLARSAACDRLPEHKIADLKYKYHRGEYHRLVNQWVADNILTDRVFKGGTTPYEIIK